MSREWDALEADFLRFYGLDLRRLLWVEGVGCRRLWSLMRGLPAESAFQSELQSKPAASAAAPASGAGWRALARRMTGR